MILTIHYTDLKTQQKRIITVTKADDTYVCSVLNTTPLCRKFLIKSVAALITDCNSEVAFCINDLLCYSVSGANGHIGGSKLAVRQGFEQSLKDGLDLLDGQININPSMANYIL